VTRPGGGRGPAGAVLVTGASTGIGYACAMRMCSRGWGVLAGVRREADAERLRAEMRRGGRQAGVFSELEPVLLDVTSAEQVAALPGTINGWLSRWGLEGLRGVVNNAGVAVAGPLECVPLEEVRRQLEVNTLGALAVSQACLPMLRRWAAGSGAGGGVAAGRPTARIVMISSISGRNAAPLLGPYAMSKFAMEAMADGLRRELRAVKAGVDVSVVQPGAIATPIWAKPTGRETWERGAAGAGVRTLYGAMVPAVEARIAKVAEGAAPVGLVADAVEHALCDARPFARRLVGADAKLTALLGSALPARWMDALVARALGLS
jgi:NAD(P)-dependent dehydrogenase (short-subunit alcohol dehydrogenase family)